MLSYLASMGSLTRPRPQKRDWAGRSQSSRLPTRARRLACSTGGRRHRPLHSAPRLNERAGDATEIENISEAGEQGPGDCARTENSLYDDHPDPLLFTTPETPSHQATWSPHPDALRARFTSPPLRTCEGRSCHLPLPSLFERSMA